MFARVIPCLLLRDRGLVKTIKFKSDIYVGDPINAVRIFNDKEADELILLDIDATNQARGPDFDLIEDIASECFMPTAYGGGIRTFTDVQRVIRSGVEKVVINSAAYRNLDIIKKTAATYGTQAVVVSIDVRKPLFGDYQLYSSSGTVKQTPSLEGHIQAVVEAGAGEILINSIDRDGTMKGYDLDVIRRVCAITDTPVIACGGAGSVQDLKHTVERTGASAVAAGSIFVFHGPRKAVLINYPKDAILNV